MSRAILEKVIGRSCGLHALPAVPHEAKISFDHLTYSDRSLIVRPAIEQWIADNCVTTVVQVRHDGDNYKIGFCDPTDADLFAINFPINN